jgi:hypothetical protein
MRKAGRTGGLGLCGTGPELPKCTGPPPEGRGALQDLDDSHEPAATGGADARPYGQEMGIGSEGLGLESGGCGRWVQGVRIPGNSGPAAGQHTAAAAVGHEPVVPDPHEPDGQHVEEEPANELAEGKELAACSAAAVALIEDRDGLRVHGEAPVIGDGDAVGIAGEIGEDGVGPMEGGFAVDDPLDVSGFLEGPVEGIRLNVAERAEVARSSWPGGVRKQFVFPLR